METKREHERFIYLLDTLLMFIGEFRETEKTLIKVNERLDALEKKETKVEKKVIKDDSSQFRTWVTTRTRLDNDADLGSTLGDMWRSYRYWRESIDGLVSKMNQANFRAEVVKQFGKTSDGSTYKGLLIFNTDEDVEAYDAEKLA